MTYRTYKKTRSRSVALLAGAALLLIGALIAGCGGGGNDSPDATAATPTTMAGKTATLSVANGGLGKILVDSQGRTLYLFKRDTGTTSMCTGACAANWPPLRAHGKPTVDGGANASLAATTKRSDGATQVTYNGHPLYRYSGDQKPGDSNGQGLNTYGGRWYALTPAGNQVSGKGSSSGGSGYAGGSGY
jgi:predicted lipoprotein with Yx(FWY)xxD motif